MSKVWLRTEGRPPTKGCKVRIQGLAYIVTAAEEPTELDDEVCVTECEVQPSDAPRGTSIINAELVKRSA